MSDLQSYEDQGARLVQRIYDDAREHVYADIRAILTEWEDDGLPDHFITAGWDLLTELQSRG